MKADKKSIKLKDLDMHLKKNHNFALKKKVKSFAVKKSNLKY